MNQSQVQLFVLSIKRFHENERQADFYDPEWWLSGRWNPAQMQVSLGIAYAITACEGGWEFATTTQYDDIVATQQILGTNYPGRVYLFCFSIDLGVHCEPWTCINALGFVEHTLFYRVYLT